MAPPAASAGHPVALVTSGGLWSLVGPWRHRAWGDEHLIYSEASGDTHQVTAAGVAVMEALAQGPASLAELVRRLGGDADDEAPMVWVAAALAAFDRLGLVERTSP